MRKGSSRDAVRIGEAVGVWPVVALVCVGAFVYLMVRGRGNIFVYDEWSWIEFRRNGAAAIFDSYNDHLLPVPLAAYQLLFRTVGLGDYAVYRALGALGHLACVVAVFSFTRRRIGVGCSLLVLVPLAFFGSGWEYEMEGVNFGFTASLAMGIAALVALDARSPVRDAVACGLLTAGLAFSEFTLLFAVGVAVAQLLEDRSLRRAWIWLAPLVVYGAWWVGFYSAVPSHSAAARVPKYAADMVASAAGGLFGQGLQRGRVIALATGALIGWRIVRRGALSPRLIGLIVTAAAFWLSVSIERNRLNQAWASHYVYVGAILIVLIAAEALRDWRPTPPVLVLGAFLAVFAVAGNASSLTPGEGYLRTSSRNARAELGALRLLGPIAPADLVMDVHYAPQLIAGPYRAAAAQLGPAPTDTPAQIAAAAEPVRAAADDVLLRGGALALADAPHAVATGGSPPAPDSVVGASVSARGGCLRVTSHGQEARATVSAGHTRALLIEAGSATIQLHARRFAAAFNPMPLPVPPNHGTIVLAVRDTPTDTPWRLAITLTGQVGICTTT